MEGGPQVLVAAPQAGPHHPGRGVGGEHGGGHGTTTRASSAGGTVTVDSEENTRAGEKTNRNGCG